MVVFETFLTWCCFENKDVFEVGVVVVVVAVDAVRCLSGGGILEKMKKPYHPNSPTGLQKSK